MTPDEREAFWEKLYKEPGFGIWIGNLKDILVDEQANKLMTEFAAKKIRERVKDPEIAKYFEPISKSLTENEDGIIKEIMELQGHEADLGGYYHTDPVKVQKIMRPSKILNQIIS